MGVQRQDRNPAKVRPRTAVPRARTLLLAGIALAALFFTLGLAAARWMPPRAPLDPSLRPPPPTSVPAEPSTQTAEPKIILDPSAVQLLPDASLKLDLPPPFEADDPAPSRPP